MRPLAAFALLQCACAATPWWHHAGLQPEEAAVVSGTVLAQDLQARPVPDVHVRALFAGDEIASTDADAEGRFVLDVDGPLSRVAVRSDRHGRRPHWELTLELTAPGYAPARLVTMAPRGGAPLDPVYLTPEP